LQLQESLSLCFKIHRKVFYDFFCVFAENSSTSFCVALFSFYIQRLNENGILSVLLLKYTFLHIRGLHCLYFSLYLKKALNTQTAKKNPLFFVLFHFTMCLISTFTSTTQHMMMVQVDFIDGWKYFTGKQSAFFWLKHSEKLKLNCFRFFFKLNTFLVLTRSCRNFGTIRWLF